MGRRFKSVLSVLNASSDYRADYMQSGDFCLEWLPAYSGDIGAAGSGTLVPAAPGKGLRRRLMSHVTDGAVPPRPEFRGIVFR